MIGKRMVVLTVACAVLHLAPTPGQAQKEKKVEKSKEEIQEERMKKLMTAYELAEEGRQQNAPEYLITAGAILRQLSSLKDLQEMKKIDVPEITGPGKAEQDKEVKVKSLLEQSEALLKEASGMGATPGIDVNVDKLIELARKRPIPDKEERAVIGGPRLIGMIIGPGQTHTYNLVILTHGHTPWAFEANRKLRVQVVHQGGPNNVWFDQVTTLAGKTWYPLGWNPGYYSKHKTAKITIRVMNNLSVPAYYQMMIQ